jgi:hypothetical protein
VEGATETQAVVGALSEYYVRATKALADGRSLEVSLEFDLGRAEFAATWHSIYSEVKDRPQDAQAASQRLIVEQPRLTGLTLAMARCNAVILFRDFKRLLEFLTSKTEGLPGYAATSAVPHALAGFLYMSASLAALHFEAWDVLRELLNAKFEYSYRSGRPLFSHGFDHPYFFHSEAFGRQATRIHDLFRQLLLNSRDIEHATGLADEDLLNTYVQAQMLMCLKAAQLCEQGEDTQIWADFGRFYGGRVAALFERVREDPGFAVGLCKSFDESPQEFLTNVNPRLAFIRSHFWTPGRYFFESLTSWDPAR